MAAPIELRLSSKKPRTIAGEGITLNIAHRVLAELDMETVELNRNRTTIRVVPLVASENALILTGADHIALHRVHPFSQIGRAFHAPAGSAWTSELALLNYTQPLPAGRYQIELSYRYADTPEETVAANPIEIEVLSATLLTCEYRWFGGGTPRDQLACIWTAQAGQQISWIFQTASRRDPGAILTALDLELADPPLAQPRLAHLNDIADFHYERHLIWIEEQRLGYLKVSDEKRLSETQYVNHGLKSPLLLEPPLQFRGGGIGAVVAATASGATRLVLIVVDGQGHANSRVISTVPALRGLPVVIWNDRGDEAAGNVYSLVEDRRYVMQVEISTGSARMLAAPGEIYLLAADQWLDRGTVMAMSGGQEALQIVGWENTGHEADAKVLSGYSREFLRTVLTGGVTGSATLADPPDLAMLFPGREGWAALSRGRYLSTARNTVTPRLVATPDGLFLVEYYSDRGFRSTRVEGAPAPDLL
ncbi:MAG TPA: hypothetical protein VGL72_26605 [Bryobacteraceae bacterium]|jgi:hypothetical protein